MDIQAVSHVNEKQTTSVTKTDSTKSTDFSKELKTAKQKTTTLDAIFQKAADTYHVDVNLLKAMAKAESEFQNNCTSHCGAKGIMQLMPATAKYLGVKDPYDPEQNIMGGAKYISRLLKQYNGNVNLALAAYNAGSGNVKKYGGIPPFKETQNYIRKINGFMKKGVTIPSSLNVVPNKSGTDYSSVKVTKAASQKNSANAVTAHDSSNIAPAEKTSAAVTDTTAKESTPTVADTIAKAMAEVSNDNVAIVNLTDTQQSEIARLQQEYAALNAMEVVLAKLSRANSEEEAEEAAERLLQANLDLIAVDNLSTKEDSYDTVMPKEESKEQVLSRSIHYTKTVLGLLTDGDV